jgi:zinc protease
MSALAGDAGVLIDTLAEVVLEPAFLDEEVERKRSQILGILERRKDDYGDVVRKKFFRMIYGAHPYGRVKEGTSDSITAMSRGDIERFYGARYAPRQSILAIVGDVDPASCARQIEERFGGWNRPLTPAASSSPIPPPARSIAAVQQDVTQAYIRMGNIGITRNDPDHEAAIVMNFILGGSGFGSRLMKNLREERGLTYGVYSNSLQRKEPGYFFAGTQTGTDTMNEAIVQMLAEIRRFVEDGPTEDELAWAKRYFTGSLPLQLETNDQLAQRVLEQEFFGLADQFWLLELEKMQRVTREEVMAAARRQIHPDQFAIVVLADLRTHSLSVPGFETIA